MRAGRGGLGIGDALPGGEGAGLRTNVVRACDGLVCLARGGALGTLNVATAGAILLYEVSRQRATARQSAVRDPRGDRST